METKDRLEPGSAASEPPSDLSQPKNNVLELSFKTRRHFVFCSTATSPRRKPILGPIQGLRSGQKLDPLQDILVSPNTALPLSSSAMFLEDHDYSSSANRGRGIDTGSCTLPILPLLTKQQLGSVMYNGLDSNILQVSKISTESVGEDMKLRHLNPMSDLMQAMCEEVMQVECDVGGLGERINGLSSSDVHGICDSKNSDSHSSKRTEVSKFLSPSAFTVKVQKLDAHKDGRTVGYESSSSTQARNPIVRASWSSSSNKQNSMSRTNRCVNSSYPDCDSSQGVKVGPSTSKYQLFKVDMGSNSTTTSSLSTFCDDQTPFLSERPASGSLDSAHAGMILPSPFLIQTGLEKTLDFAEFHPMSPSNKDWDNEFNGLETTLFENELAKTCDLSGVSPFDGQDFPVHQNLFSSPPASANCVRMQQSLCAASDIKTTSARTKQGSKWSGKRQDRTKVNFDTYPFTLEDLQVRRRKPVKRQLDFGSPVDMSEETVNDLDRKKARHSHSLNRAVQEKQEPNGKSLRVISAEEMQKARRPRKSKKLRDLGKTGRAEFDHKLNASEKVDNRPCKKYRIKSEVNVSNTYGDNKDNVSVNHFNNLTNGRAMEQERLSRGTGHSDARFSHQRVPANRSVDFCAMMSTILDRWLEYLMTPQDVMRQHAIDDARSFGYNDDALDMVSNGDLEVWRILEDMEPDFVRSGFDKYFT